MRAVKSATKTKTFGLVRRCPPLPPSPTPPPHAPVSASAAAWPTSGAAFVCAKESNRQRRAAEFEQAFVASYMPAREKFVTSPRCFIPPRNHPLLAPVASRSMFLVLGCLPRSVPRLAARTLRLLANVTLCVALAKAFCLQSSDSRGLSRRARCTLYVVCV